MRVFLDNEKKWLMTSDPRNWILQEIKINKKGEEVPETQGYYHRPENLLYDYASFRMKDNNTRSINGLIRHICNVNNEVKQIKEMIWEATQDTSTTS